MKETDLNNQLSQFDEDRLEDIPEDILKGLSRDQQLLFKYAKAIIAGTVHVSLKDQKPGPLCHA